MSKNEIPCPKGTDHANKISNVSTTLQNMSFLTVIQLMVLCSL